MTFQGSTKLLLILVVYAAHFYTFTPPNKPKSNETIPGQSLAEKWLEVGQKYNYLVKGIHLLVGIAELYTCLSTDKIGSSRELTVNPTSTCGVLVLLAGVYIRYLCFKTMAHNFTFTLSIRENHQLITHGPYSVVRHPAYSGLTLVYIGLGLWHGAKGSWVRESGVLETGWGFVILGGYAFYMVGVLVSLLRPRAKNEDKELKKVFGKQWDEWAKKVPYAAIPGIL